ncbi:MAG: cyclic nucleotide-binding domain-containing protein [Candidatus Competibacteraceae bacterium]|nr:MAG: cyclic nucleotide-binding domain-containing protein [Candidatus Competibacteraceae bacterium]
MQIYKSGLALSEMSDQFKQIPFLKEFRDSSLKELLSAGRMLAYEQDELIIPESAFGDRFYVLLSGRVRVVKDKSVLAVLEQAGTLFGELAALGNEIRTASIFAMEMTWCLELNPGVLQKLPAAERDACHALLYRVIAQVVAERLKQTTNELTLAAKELEVTRSKLAELRRTSQPEMLDDELELAIEQLRRTKEKLSHLGRAAGHASTELPESS